MVRFNYETEYNEDAPFSERLSAFTGIKKENLVYEIRKKSIDARKKNIKFVYTVDILGAKDEKALANRVKGNIIENEAEYVFPKASRKKGLPPVIAGFGPAGIFSALMLARAGYDPIVVERGKDVDSRKIDVDKFFESGILDENSNIQYGEGGAGAFSDGKLNTLIKDKSFRGSFVLKELVKAGAPEEIKYIAKPHVGTDLLRDVVKNIRKEIISLGGEIRFETKLTDIKTENGKIYAVVTDKGEIKTDTLFLAVGQSSRELTEMLYSHGANIEKKPFSVGFRVEHPQNLINISQYGENADMRFLPPAEYKLFTHTKNGRTVYSFCMCPGGHVIAAASENGKLVTNGMSCHSRDGANANAAILCEVLPEDLKGDIFSGFDFRDEIEKRAYALGGNNFKAPCMRLGDYLGDAENDNQKVIPTYPIGVNYVDFSPIFPKEMNDSFKEAFKDFGKKIKGFDSPSALITAVESRTSSPVRILRDDDRQSNIKGLYPLGEGAGYAGGIMSAAIDGLHSSEMYVANRCGADRTKNAEVL